jgi:hypothetical protein
MTFTIDDPLHGADTGAIEVIVRVSDGTTARWCFFMTPEALRSCGDTLESHPDVRVHIGVPHMFVVSRIIEEVLRDLEARGELLAHTLPIG